MQKVNKKKAVEEALSELSRNKSTSDDSAQDSRETSSGYLDAAKDVVKNVADAVYYPVTAQKYLNKLMAESDSFSYDMNADPVYKRYRDMYEKESELAAKDIFGLATALTGGYGNSYAATAVSGVVSDYLDKLTEKGQQLRDNAYDEHRDKISDLYTAYKEFSSIADKKYERRQQEKEAGKAEEKAISQALKDLAFDAADVGDYSLLEQLGINTDSLKEKDSLEKAELFAKYGDYSGLAASGIDISKLNEEESYELARLFAEYGDYSLLNLIGVDTDNIETKDYYNRLLLWARYLKALR